MPLVPCAQRFIAIGTSPTELIAAWLISIRYIRCASDVRLQKSGSSQIDVLRAAKCRAISPSPVHGVVAAHGGTRSMPCDIGCSGSDGSCTWCTGRGAGLHPPLGRYPVAARG